MTVTPTIATCPRCGDNRETIFIRSGDDLVCQSCRGGAAPLPHDAPPPPRRIFGRR